MTLITIRPKLWSAVGGALKNPIAYTLTHSDPFLTASLHQADGTLIATLRQRTRNGSVTLDVSGYLKKLLKPALEYSTNQISNPDGNASAGYFLKYLDETDTLISDVDNLRYAVLAALDTVDGDMDAHVIKQAPILTEISRVCQQSTGTNTGYQVITYRDQYGNESTLVSTVQDLDACPLGGASYYSAAISRESTYSRNNCGTGYAGGTWTITIAVAAYSSTVSQAVADALAEAAADALDTQANANLNGTCTLIPIYIQKNPEFTFSPNRRGFILMAYSDAAFTEPLIISTPLTIYYRKQGNDCSGVVLQQKSVVMEVGPDHVLAGTSFIGLNDDDAYDFPSCSVSGFYVYTLVAGAGYGI